MTLSEFNAIVAMIDKRTAYYTDGFTGEYRIPKLSEEAIRQLKVDILSLVDKDAPTDSIDVTVRLKDFVDIDCFLAGVNAILINHFCKGKDCDACKAQSGKSTCYIPSISAEILDYFNQYGKGTQK